MNSCQKSNIKLELKDIKKSFDNTKILDKITIEVKEGELVSILGPSGSGKSTIFNIITGITKEDSGEVNVNGEISYMHQKDLLLPWKDILDNVSLPLVLKGESKKEARNKAEKYFEIFGLSGYEKNHPHQLSGGMRQRANFLRTFVNSSDIMLLDEPFGALDSITRYKMQEWLLEVRNNLNITTLFITHDVEEAVFLSDRIYIISEKPSRIKHEFRVDKENRENLKRQILDIL
jgi:ABC-type nitrate/sulfonate/bicarbonate transport system ATPase subunit